MASRADKRFRRAHIKPSRKRRVDGKRVWGIVRVALLVMVLVYGAWAGSTFALAAPTLKISHIVVRGHERLATGEVLALVAGLRGRNILTVDLADWQERLLASPWVAEATLRRVLPGRIDITIRERQAMGIGRLSSSMYLVDGSGVVIDEYGPGYADLDLPIVDGLAGRGRSAVAAPDPARARLAAAVIASLSSDAELSERVSQIDVSDPHDAQVMLDGDTAMLRLGEEDFASRLRSYLDLAPAVRERIADIDYVDLRFAQRLYVRPAGGTGCGARGVDCSKARGK